MGTSPRELAAPSTGLTIEGSETHHKAAPEITAASYCSGQVSKSSQDLRVMSKKNTVDHPSRAF